MCEDLNPEDGRFPQGWPAMPTPKNPGSQARAAGEGCAECRAEDPCAFHRLFRLTRERQVDAGHKADAGKPRWDLMSFPLLDQVAQVLAAGAAEYGAENWRKVPDARSRYRAALFRHLCAFMCGEKIDPKSGKPHLAHATCNLMFLFELE